MKQLQKYFSLKNFQLKNFPSRNSYRKNIIFCHFFFEIAEYLCSQEHYTKRPITKSLASLIRYHLSKVRGACDILLHCIKKEAKTMAGVEESK